MAVAESQIASTAADGKPALPATGSSFYLGMRILPRQQRQAMFAVYAFCRAVDDIADEDGPLPARRAELQRWHDDIDLLFTGKTSPLTRELAGPTEQFGLRRDDFQAVIDGMAMDLNADLHAPDWATLDLYCDRVASAVGRLSVRIFGLEPDVGDALAYHLGRALQLTNILRDVDEDAAIGRLYLPCEPFRAAGIDVEGRTPTAIVAATDLTPICEEVAERAAAHFKQADKVMAKCPRRAVRAPRLMEAVYRQYLTALTARGWAPPRAPVKLSKLLLVGALLRYGIV